MITVSEALQIVLAQHRHLGTEMLPLLQCTGRTLAQDVVADRDFPPYHRVTMDGIAIQQQAFTSGRRIFRIQDIQAAGRPALRLQSEADCLEVMTGAILPEHTDAVIRYEDCTIADGIATVNLENINMMQNVHRQGTDALAGAMLLQKQQLITPGVVAALATVGSSSVQVYRLPKVAVCATGDELVEVEQVPQLHQIRQSNSYMLTGALASCGITADRYHLPDDADKMRIQLENIISQYDAILFSGAVSKGKFDHLPEVLVQIGMQKLFHGIAQRPGKPFLFGSFPGQALVFAFPGNPVSTFICFEIYFKAWLKQQLCQPPMRLQAHLGQAVTFKPALTYHIPARLAWNDGKTWVEPILMSTSGDMTVLLQVDAIITLPADREKWLEGELVEVLMLK